MVNAKERSSIILSLQLFRHSWCTCPSFFPIVDWEAAPRSVIRDYNTKIRTSRPSTFCSRYLFLLSPFLQPVANISNSNLFEKAQLCRTARFVTYDSVLSLCKSNSVFLSAYILTSLKKDPSSSLLRWQLSHHSTLITNHLHFRRAMARPSTSP